jgi:hypothetical protein
MFKFIIGATLLCLVSVIGIRSQTDMLSSSGTECEVNNLYLDRLRGEVAKGTDRVFLISYSSKSEKSGIDNKRLGYTRFISTDFKRFPKDKLTIATGERATEKDIRLEFWIGSKLFWIMSLSRNQIPCYLTHTYDPPKSRRGKKKG